VCLGGLAAAAAANARERKRKTDEKNGKKGRVGSFWGTVGQPIHHPYTTAQNVASSEAEQSTHHRCLPPPPFNFSHATHGHTHRSYTLKTTRVLVAPVVLETIYLPGCPQTNNGRD